MGGYEMAESPVSGNVVPNGDGYASSLEGSEGETQDGVKRIEAVAMTWTKWGLIAAYIGYVSYSRVISLFNVPGGVFHGERSFEKGDETEDEHHDIHVI
jgi:hypothetical protein